MPQNLAERTKHVPSISPVNTNASNTGAAVDCKGFERVLWVINTGVLTGGGYDVTIEESDASGGTYAAISGAAVSLVDADDSLSKMGGTTVNPAKPFQRAVATETGTLTSSYICVSALLHESKGAEFPVAGAASFNVK